LRKRQITRFTTSLLAYILVFTLIAAHVSTGMESGSISITASPTTITTGENTTISGSITPASVGETVTIWYRINGTAAPWGILATAITNATSQYSNVTAPSDIGTYELKATWIGETHAAESSPPHPTVEVVGAHDINITKIALFTTEVTVGENVDINVTVKNEGHYSETFDVYVYADLDTTDIGDEIVLGPKTKALNAGANTTLSFSWDTIGVAEGTYTISAEAVVAVDDHPDNNLFIHGTVTVSPVLKRDVAATDVTAPAEVTEGDVVTISVDTANLGNLNETFDVKVTYDTTLIETRSVFLAAGATTTEDFDWDTSGLTADDYTITAEAVLSEDEDLTNNKATTLITINPKLAPPVAHFTYEPIDPFLSQNVTFDASASTPDGGDIDSYEWNFGDGTTGISMNVTHAYADYGNFTVTLNVTDSEGLWNATTDTVRVYPHPPIVSFTFSPLTPYINETVTFNATGSYDPDGDIVWYYWSFGDDTYLNATDQIAQHAYVDNGTYTVTLVVSDNEGLNSTASAIVTVPNRPPVAIFTESAEIVLTSLAIYFDASDSYDPDGSILNYFWDFGDGNNAAGVTVDHAYADDGVYTVTLTITDDDGETTSKSATKTVSNRPPIALFTENATTVLTGEIIHFDASGSNDPDGLVISYFWDFGDGTDATGVTVNHAYEDDGVYTVTLVVTDDDGKTASKSAVKTVSNRPPIALFTDDATNADVDELIRFDASGSYDPDGIILNYFWDFGDGNNATMCVILDHSFAQNGEYLVTLTVTDDDGTSSSASATMTVKGSSGWPLYLIAGTALGIAGLTGAVIYIIFRRKRKTASETSAPENKPFITLYVPRSLFVGYEKLTKAADNSVVLRRT